MPRHSGSVILLFLLTGCGGKPTAAEKSGSSPGSQTSPKISAFYASPDKVEAGEKALLCYTTESATKVRLNPPVADVWPALTRCVEVTPKTETTYTLTAEDASGKSVSQSATITIGASKPKLTDLWVSSLEIVPPEKTVTFCYTVQHSTGILLEPTGWRSTTPKSCIQLTPEKTTTYTITAYSAERLTDTGHFTIRVR